jgi:hypothetical protein
MRFLAYAAYPLSEQEIACGEFRYTIEGEGEVSFSVAVHVGLEVTLGDASSL